MLACDWAEFVELFAHIRYTKGEEIRAALRRFRIERRDVLADLSILKNREIQFYKQWQDGIEPPFILPEI